MPELPEVETVRCQVESALLDYEFVSVEETEPAMLRDCDDEDVRGLLPGSRIREVGRVGKFLVLLLSGGTDPHLTLHLGMTGQLLVRPEDHGTRGGSAGEHSPPPRHEHMRFLFRLRSAEGHRSVMEFRDARKFGRVHVTRGGPAPRLQQLGPDGWRGSWDRSYLAGRLAGRKVPLKAFLLDQKQVCGIGNIYADEILWWAGLNPLRPAGSLDPAEVQRLADEIRVRLGEGVRRLGCTTSDFVDTQGKPGSFQEHLQAYRRHGQRCTRCGETLVRVVIAGRGTAYCPGCQS